MVQDRFDQQLQHVARQPFHVLVMAPPEFDQTYRQHSDTETREAKERWHDDNALQEHHARARLAPALLEETLHAHQEQLLP